ncbi:phosphotransferase family protein [Erwinia sp. CGal63]|uniref:phosphotransferase family protein n=1 Tax=Erwinia sp. CGal63 TaxID=2919889 RepID=UPI00300B88B3
MLQDKDVELAQRDRDLPGLAALLDHDLLTEKLRALPPFAGLRSLSIDYLRYKPGTSCVATLILKLADGQRCHLAAKALTLARFEVSWRHPKRQKLVIEKDPFAPLAIPALGIILSYPQHDRELCLSLLNASPERDAQLRRWLPEIAQEAHLELKILRYKPERRLLALLSCDGKPWATLRFASAERFAAMLTGNQLGHATGEIALLATLPKLRLLIVRWVEGHTLCPEQGGSLPEQDVYQLGRRLADVHRLKLTLPEAPPRSGIEEAGQVLNTLRAVIPDRVVLFTGLLHRLQQKLANHPLQSVASHGDFTFDQVVRRAADNRLQLIDWDRGRAGDPAADLATFQARLELQVIEKTLTPLQASRAIAALHAGYRRQRGELPLSLADFTALALLQLAAEPFRKRATEWPQQIILLLQRVEQLMAQSEPSVEDRFTAALSGLLNSDRMAEPLRQALSLPASATLAEATLLTSKPGRRAVLAYRWRSAPDDLRVIGKYRQKGFDPHGFNVQQALWHDGFRGDSEVIVPEPLAALAEKKLWLQRQVAGQRVTETLIAGDNRLAATGALVGRALARLQHSRAALRAVAGKSWTVDDELAMLRQQLTQAAAARPAWAERIASVSRACVQLASTLTPSASWLLHRDFYPAQLLLASARSGQLAVLDFDLAAIGPPSLDAGNYVAHLREQALRDYGAPDALVAHEDAFVDAWLAASTDADIANLSIFTTLALARHIAISLLFPGRHHTTEALLSLCERRLKRLPEWETR